MASAITSSGRRFAPASTIMIASRVPATIRSRSDSSSWLCVGLMTNSPPMRPTRTAPTGPLNGISLIVERRGGGDRPDDVRVVLLIGREDRDDELDVVLVALGEQRADRPVRLAGREDRRLGRTRLALDEAARDLARGVHPLLEVDREREEVEARAGLRPVGGAEHHGVAVANGDGAAGEPGEPAGFDGQRTTTELGLEDLWHWVQILSAVQRDQSCGGPAGAGSLRSPALSGRGERERASGGVRAVR